MSNRKVTQTTQPFTGTTYRVAGDPESVAFKTREQAEQRVEALADADVITDILRNPNR
ncbi:hypothetical protein [Streptomyces turgidiscabies]|uniref:hypothetical protein n=1 Tax=Streptomyces turgidiscabies TaxID=85558 RepID=UPI0038F6BC07